MGRLRGLAPPSPSPSPRSAACRGARCSRRSRRRRRSTVTAKGIPVLRRGLGHRPLQRGRDPRGPRVRAEGARAHRHDLLRRAGDGRRVPVRLRAGRRGTASGFPMRTSRGIERTEWVNTDQVEWYQDVILVDGGWEHPRRAARVQAGPVQRDELLRLDRAAVRRPRLLGAEPQRAYVQVNLPSWADGGEPEHTGAFERVPATGASCSTHRGLRRRRARRGVGLPGRNTGASPTARASWRVVNTATHDGRCLDSSTKTLTEWTFRSTGSSTSTRCGCCR